MLRVNWAGVSAGTIAAYLVGFLWYGLIFNAHWIALAHPHLATMQSPAGMGAGFVIVTLSVFGLDWVIRRTGSLGWISGTRVGLSASLFFGITVACNDFAYGIKDLRLIPIDLGYILVWFAVAGCIVGGLQRRAKVS